jgi:hypothetical protein
MKNYYQKTAFNPNRSVVFNQPWKSGITSMIDSYIENKNHISQKDLTSIEKFVTKCNDSKFREEVQNSIKKTIKLEKQNKIYYPNIDPKILSKPPKDDELLEIQSNLEHRFLSLRGIFRYDVTTNKATQMVAFSRNNALFGVDYRSFDFEIFTEKKKKTMGCFYLMQYWHRGISYAKIILVDEKESAKTMKGKVRGLQNSLKNNTIHGNHKYYVDREENSIVFENVIDCKILRIKQKKKKFETIFLYEDQKTLLLLEFSYDDLFNFSLRWKSVEELKDIQLLRIFSDSKRKILLGLFKNNIHNGIMLFYFRNPPEKNSFLQFKSINLQKSTSNLLKATAKKELVSSNHIFKTEADNHILDFCATSTGYVILSLRNILFLNHKFKLLRSLNLKPFGLGYLISVFPYGPSVILNFLKQSFVCSPNSPPKAIISLDSSKGECMAGLLPDRVLCFNHFTSFSKFEFEMNKVFHEQFQGSNLKFSEWYFDHFSASRHFFSSPKSKFKQMVWMTHVESPSQELMSHILISIETFYKEKVLHRFFTKARSLLQSSSLKSSELDSSIFLKSLSSQNFRKCLNDYFGFVKYRNKVINKVFSKNLNMDSILFFIRNSHLPADKFSLVTKFLETEDLIDKLERCGKFSVKLSQNQNSIEKFLELCTDLLREIGPRGNLHLENKKMFKDYLGLHFIEKEIIKIFADKQIHDVFGLAKNFTGFSRVVNDIRIVI